MPGQTLVLSGSFPGATNETISVMLDGSKLVPAQVSNNSVKVVVPSSVPAGVWTVTVVPTGVTRLPPRAQATTSLPVNAPDPWWVQGDQGDSASPGGWIRVVGRCLALSKGGQMGNEVEVDAWDQIRKAAASGDIAALDAARKRLSRDFKTGAAVDSKIPPTALRLTPTKTAAKQSPVVLTALSPNSTRHSAHFEVPADLPAGEYTVAVSNGYPTDSPLFVDLASFVSPAQPRVSTFRVAPAWKPDKAVFRVSEFGPHRLPCNLNDGACTTADDAVEKALQAARDNGGGTVYFDVGTYYLSKPVVVPPGTVLKGAGTSLTAIYMAEDTPESVPTPPFAYFYLDGVANFSGPMRGPWAMEDLSIYVTAYHQFVIHVDNRTDGFRMQRVRVRANAWTLSDGPYTQHDGRWQNFSWPGVGVLLQMNGKNWAVMDCDLFSDHDVINSYSPTYPGGVGKLHGAEYGYIARNQMWNGGSSHFINQWQQVIFEDNEVTGISVLSGGQSFGTGPWGGFTHNYLSKGNRIQYTWSNDREVLTFDDAGGSYFGPVARVDGETITTEYDCKAPESMEWGGWAGGSVVVLNGTGTGQWRRIVVPGPTGPDLPQPNNRTWVLDRPFDIPPSPGDFIEIMPFRGTAVWERNRFVDCGPFQFYGHAIQNILSENTFERIDVVMVDGQWRGWVPAEGRLGGVANNGMQPNVQIQILDSEIIEGNNIFPFNKSGGGGPYPTRPGNYVLMLSACETEGKNCPTAHNMFVVLRGNRLRSNAGISIGRGSRDVLIEDCSVDNWPVNVTSGEPYAPALVVEPGTDYIMVVE